MTRRNGFRGVFPDNASRDIGPPGSLFVFLRDDLQQNGVKLLTPVSDLVFNALSNGTIHFALYGSSLNLNLIG